MHILTLTSQAAYMLHLRRWEGAGTLHGAPRPEEGNSREPTTLGMLGIDPTSDPPDRTEEQLGELRGRVRSLEDQLGQEHDANRENRRIIAALTQRIPELEAPASPEPRDVDLSATEEVPTSSPTKKPRPRPEAGAETLPEPRSWWRRVFGA